MHFDSDEPASEKELEWALKITDAQNKMILEYLLKNPEELKKWVEFLKNRKDETGRNRQP